MKYDPIEDTAEYKAILPELEKKIAERLKGIPERRGYCYKVWKAKREILKEDYGIDWKSPGVLNRHIKFD